MHSHPVLIHRFSASEHANEFHDAFSTEQSRPFGGFFEIRPHGHHASTAYPQIDTEQSQILALSVRHNDEESLLPRITIGRSRSNDLVIPYPQISKFHAYITEHPNGVYALHDAGATNGTFIADTRLIPHTPYPLPAHCEIRFGSHTFEFYTPQAFAETQTTSAL